MRTRGTKNTCVRDGCREGSESSRPGSTAVLYNPPPPFDSKATEGGIQWRTLVLLTRHRGEVAPEGGSLPTREKLFGSITGRDNKALPPFFSSFSLSLTRWICAARENPARKTDDGRRCARASSSTGEKRSTGRALRLLRTKVNQSGSSLLNWKPPPRKKKSQREATYYCYYYYTT